MSEKKRRRVRKPSPTLRRVTIAGRTLEAGRHELTLRVPGSGGHTLLAQVVVGQHRGPRAFVVGGLSPDDAGGLAIVRAAARAVDPRALAGTLVLIGRAAPHGDGLATAFRPENTAGAAAGGGLPARVARFMLTTVTEKAIFGVELRGGAPGRASWPHVRADLRDERLRRLARAFGVEVVLDTPGPRGSLRRAATAAGAPTLVYEAGEQGRQDRGATERGVAGILNLLRARRMLPGAPTRPAWRATVTGATWRKGRRDGWVVPLAPAGTLVAAGDPLVETCDRAGRRLAVLKATARSVVLAAPTAARTAARDPLVLVARVRASSRPRAAVALPPRHRIGWCEWISLPDLGIPRLHAKIDTGARTSALHVRAMRIVTEAGGRQLLELRLPVGRRTSHGDALARVPLLEHVIVRDSGGHPERRPVIETTLVVGPVRRRVRITLTDRGDMLFPMLVGRTALGTDFDIDAAVRHLLSV